MHVWALIWVCIFSAPALAEPIVERHDNVAFNWGTMRWEFYGEAVLAESQGSEAFKAAEKQAWQHGLNTIQQAVSDLQIKEMNSPKERAIEIARDATKATYSRNTTYFSSGLVRVELENALVAARAPQGVELGVQTGEKANNSALIIELDRSVQPSPTFRVLNESGEVLYESKDVSPEYFNKHLMGRWFRGKSGWVYEKYAGASPVGVMAVVRNNDFVVENSQWQKVVGGNQALLAQAKVIVVLP